MLKFLIIIGFWITPGILLFLYLLWVSKRRRASSAQVELPLTNKPVPAHRK